LLAVASLVFAYYVHAVSQERRVPVFAIDPQRVELFTAESASRAPIRVFTADGQPVTKDLTAVHWYFWNAGRKPIKGADVLEPLRIRLGDPSGRILDFKVTRTSRPVARVHLDRDPGDPARALLLSFAILEMDDGAAGQLIYVGGRAAPVTISGTIEGVRSVASPEVLAKSRRPISIVKAILILVLGLAAAVVFAFVVVGGIGGGISLIGRALAKRFPGLRGFGGKIANAVVFLLVAGLVFYLIFLIVENEEKAWKQRPASVAPSTIAD
jgi:hypothetical protein